MRIREEDFELEDGLFVDFTANYVSGEEDIGRSSGWRIEIDAVYAVLESRYLLTGEEELRLTSFNSEMVEEEIIKYLEG